MAKARKLSAVGKKLVILNDLNFLTDFQIV